MFEADVALACGGRMNRINSSTRDRAPAAMVALILVAMLSGCGEAALAPLALADDGPFELRHTLRGSLAPNQLGGDAGAASRLLGLDPSRLDRTDISQYLPAERVARVKARVTSEGAIGAFISAPAEEYRSYSSTLEGGVITLDVVLARSLGSQIELLVWATEPQAAASTPYEAELNVSSHPDVWHPGVPLRLDVALPTVLVVQPLEPHEEACRIVLWSSSGSVQRHSATGDGTVLRLESGTNELYAAEGCRPARLVASEGAIQGIVLGGRKLFFGDIMSVGAASSARWSASIDVAPLFVALDLVQHRVSSEYRGRVVAPDGSAAEFAQSRPLAISTLDGKGRSIGDPSVEAGRYSFELSTGASNGVQAQHVFIVAYFPPAP